LSQAYSGLPDLNSDKASIFSEKISIQSDVEETITATVGNATNRSFVTDETMLKDIPRSYIKYITNTIDQGLAKNVVKFRNQHLR
jgi:hypothetical protein